MGIGLDIKLALVEVGTKVTFTSGEATQTEYIKEEPQTELTSLFIREHVLQAMLPYDTKMVVGDVVRLDDVSSNYYCIIANKSPDVFENSVIRYKSTLYKCNVLFGEIHRSSGEVWSDDYHKTLQFHCIKGECFGVFTSPQVSQQRKEYGQVDIKKFDLYFPTKYGTAVNDRVLVASGEYYRVVSLSHNNYSGVDVIQLEEDTR